MRRLIRHTIAILTALFVVQSALPSQAFAQRKNKKPPNVLFLMSDDHRGDIMGHAGDPLVLTPNMDRLAAEGVRFINFASQSPICVPSRATFQTGMYQPAHGVYSGPPMDVDTQYLAEAFNDAGYATGYAGKWHLNGGYFLESREANGYVAPNARTGYQEWDGYNQGIDHDRPMTFDESVDPPILVEVEGYDWTPSYYSDVFLDFARRHGADDEPWMYFLSYALPHDPLEAPPEYLDMYPPENFDLYGMAPELEGNIGEDLETVFRRILQVYYAQISFLDSEIGIVLDGLESMGLTEDTIVIYLSDHGQLLGSHYFEVFNQYLSPTWAFRDKALPYKNAIKAPLIIRWPAKIQQGTEVDALVSTVDLPLTVLDLAGVKAPYKMQGNSMREWCLGRQGFDAEALYLNGIHRGYEWEALWTGKYLYSSSGALSVLYDHVSDPMELTNLYDDPAYEGVRQGLQLLLDELAIIAVTIPDAPEEDVESPEEEKKANKSGDSGDFGPCFIATAAYGTPLADELYAFRTIRDERLLTNAPGSAFVDTYYRLSPPVAEWISEREGARAAVRGVLTAILVLLEFIAPLLLINFVYLGSICFARCRKRST